MAQVLKKEQRDKILKSAKREFLKVGIAKTSLRTIAKNADMTVGNIYRYFKNKQAIVDEIIGVTMEKLSEVDKLIIQGSNIISTPKENEQESGRLHGMLIAWANELALIQETYPDEMCIIVNDETINKNYSNKMSIMVKDMIARQGSDFSTLSLNMISTMISKSVYLGIREGLKLQSHFNLPKEEFEIVMQNYLLFAFSALRSN